MDNCKWKITYNNPNHCSMMELAHTPTRPPWRPAASSITAFKENEGPIPLYAQRSKLKSNEVTVPPQYMSATELIAAMPRRQRMPKQQALSNSFAIAEENTPHEPREYEESHAIYPKTPRASAYGDLDSMTFGKPSKRPSGHTPKLGLDQAVAKSVAYSRSRSNGHGSQLASPPSGARSLLGSAAPSERTYTAQSRHSRHAVVASPGFPSSQPSSPRRMASSADRASPASCARSAENSPSHSPAFSGSPQISRHRTTATNSGGGLVSAHDMHTSQGTHQSSSSRYGTRSNGSLRMNTTETDANFPSRGITSGSSVRSSARGISASSNGSHRSMMGGRSPQSGRCSPPTPPSPSSPTYSPY